MQNIALSRADSLCDGVEEAAELAGKMKKVRRIIETIKSSQKLILADKTPNLSAVGKNRHKTV
jgi:hypothetical protein